MPATKTPEEMRALIGEALPPSRWIEVTQDKIDQFADVTEDWQFIHVDPEKAARTPFGGTIAHGFLTLSLLSALVPEDRPVLEGTAMGVNYGFDKVRFVSPVRAGKRVRGVLTMRAFEEVRPKQFQTTWDVSVEIEGEAKPALAAVWLTRVFTA